MLIYNVSEVNKFFIDLNIKNFEPYFDPPSTLAKMFTLRGVPTTILINKEGKVQDTYNSFIDPLSKKIINQIESIL